MNEIIKKIKIGYQKGFFHIFSSSVLNKIFTFCGGILLIRIISKEDFGLYNYSQNLLSIFLLINGFGITEGLMQFGSKCEREEQEKYVKYSIKVGIISNIFLMIVMLIYCFFGIFKIEGAKKIFFLMLGFPVINTIFSIIQIKLRIELKNQEMAKTSNLYTLFNIIGMICGGYINGIIGVIIGKYIGSILGILISISNIKKIFFLWRKIGVISREERKKINKFSMIAMLNNGISELLYIADIFLIGVIIAEKNILASYKTATLIPMALNFIPLSVMVYAYPYFAKNSKNIKWLRDKYKELLKYSILINFSITILLILFSKLIIKMVFGENYMDSLEAFIILSIGYFFAATFRIPAGSILNAIGKIKFNFYNGILSGLLNIILDILLIKKYGSIGAAYATLSIFIFSGLIGNLFLKNELKKIR